MMAHVQLYEMCRMETPFTEFQSNHTCRPPTDRSSAEELHILLDDHGVNDILTTSEVVAYANEVLQVVQFPAGDLDALARGFVDVMNAGCYDSNTRSPTEAADDFVGRLIGYAYMLTRAEPDAVGEPS